MMLVNTILTYERRKKRLYRLVWVFSILTVSAFFFSFLLSNLLTVKQQRSVLYQEKLKAGRIILNQVVNDASMPMAQDDTLGLNSLLKDALVAHLEQNQEEVALRDLYELGFNPVLSLEDMAGQRNGLVADDVKREQEFIVWADCLTFIHPIWWTGLPAMMKGYIDRVFSYGFAYRYDNGVQKGLLTGKQAIIINTHGKSNSEYEAIGMNAALSLTSDRGIYSYCGLAIQKHFFFDRADRPSPESVEIWKTQILSSY